MDSCKDNNGSLWEIRIKNSYTKTLAPLSVIANLAFSQTGLAQEILPLPNLEDCASTLHPILPEKWVATGLLQDFVLPHLTFANFTYDDSAQAFRFALSDRYGTDRDILVTQDQRLYSLTGGEFPTSCNFETSSSPYTVPSRDWLDDDAICVGEAPILEQNQSWWKTPRDQGADWIWFNTANSLPFRTMYYEDVPITQPVPIYEHYTFNYFPQFEEVTSTNLSEILEFCEQSTDKPTPSQSWEGFDAHELTKNNSYPTPSADPLKVAGNWIPGLRECESVDDLPPPWPDQVQGTVFMTAVSFDSNPFPSRVFYDWHARAQNTSLYYAPPTDDYVQVALLTGDTGYIRIEDEEGEVSMCQQALPGPQVPNWKAVDGCECRARIAPGTTLNPSNVTTSVLWCATDLSADQVFWTWYSEEGEPVVFMQTNASPTAGTGLNLADYVDWQPGSVAPAGTFDLPNACVGESEINVPKACHNCHLPININ